MRKLLISIGLLLSIHLALFAQATTQVSGVVTDPTGAVIPNTNIELENLGTGLKRTTTSDAAGAYSFLQVIPGQYKLTATAPGFRTTTIGDVRLLVNNPATVYIRMEVGLVTEAISVSAETVQVNTTDASIGNAIGTQAILQIPLNARNIVALLAGQPGVVFTTEGDTDSRNGAVNGGKSDQANVTLDGVDVNDQMDRNAFTSVLRMTPDSVQEFRVTTLNANADSGRSAGAQVTLVTKGGTNELHGALYEYHRNTVTTANGFFNNLSGVERPKLIRNIFGASAGGPLKKNKLFLFGNYEGRRDARDGTATRYVPSTDMRQGILHYQRTDGSIATVTPADLAQRLDPRGVNQAALKVMQSYPAPNDYTVGDNLNIVGLRFKSPTPLRWNTYIARLDYVLDEASKHTAFFRGNLQNDHSSGMPQVPGQPPNSVSLTNNKGLAAGLTSLLRPTLVSTFRYGLTRQGWETTGICNFSAVTLRGLDSIVGLQPRFRRHHSDAHHRRRYDLDQGRAQHPVRRRAALDPEPAPRPAEFVLQRQRERLLVERQRRRSESPLHRHGRHRGHLLPLRRHGRDGLGDSGQRAVQLQGGRHRAQGGRTRFPQLRQPGVRDVRYGHLEGQPGAHGYRGPALFPDAPLLREERAAGLAQRPDRRLVQPAGYPGPAGQVADGGGPHLVHRQGPGRPPLYPYHKRNFAPRLALAYSPQGSSGLSKFFFGGPGKTSIRLGWGMYYDLFGSGLMRSFSANAFGLSTLLTNPSAVLTIATAPRFTAIDQIPKEILVPAPAAKFPATYPDVFAITNGLDDTLVPPYNMSGNFSVGREFSGGWFAQASYVGRFSRRSLVRRDAAMPTNLADPKSGMSYFEAATILARQVVANVPVANVQKVPYWENLFSKAATATQTATQVAYSRFAGNLYDWTYALYGLDTGVGQGNCAARNRCSDLGPWAFFHPQFSYLSVFSSIAGGNYHGLQWSLRKRFPNGDSVDVNYTFSKSMDLRSNTERAANATGVIWNPWYPGLQRGVSDYDNTHLFNMLGVYNLPLGKGRRYVSGASGLLNALVGGWQIAGTWRWSSGFPVSVYQTGVWPTNWNNNNWADWNGKQFERKQTKNAPAVAGTGGPNMFPAPKAALDAFSGAMPGGIGMRNGIRGDGIFNMDASLSKRFRIREGHSIQFRWETFNISNTAKFDVGTASLDISVAGTYGKYTDQLTQPRVMQFGLRYEF